jgi:hypothetical protein
MGWGGKLTNYKSTKYGRGRSAANKASSKKSRKKYKKFAKQAWRKL